jgi:hypothetical protein
MLKKAAVPYFKVVFSHTPGGTEEMHENLSEDSWSSASNFYYYWGKSPVE